MKKLLLIFLLIFNTLFSYATPFLRYEKHIFPTGKIKEYKKKSFLLGFALSGGGARGIAHLGFLQALKEEGIEPDMITGTSMGAIVGAFLSAGYSGKDFFSILEHSDFEQIFSDMPDRKNLSFYKKENKDLFMGEVAFNKNGIKLPESILSGYEIQKKFFILLSTISAVIPGGYDYLYYPYRAISADIINNKGVVWKDGDLGMAVRCSMNVPGVFPPIEIDGKELVDGGVYHNLPVEELENMGADFTIAIDISSPPEKKYVDDIFSILNQILTNYMYEKTNKSAEKADLFFRIPLKNIKSSDFSNYKRIYSIGYNYGKKEVKKIKEHLSLFSKKYYVKKIVVNGEEIIVKKNLSKNEMYKIIMGKIGDNIFYFDAIYQNNTIYVKNIKRIKKVILYSPGKTVSYESDNIQNIMKLFAKVKKDELEKDIYGTYISKVSYNRNILFIYTENFIVSDFKIKNLKYINRTFVKKYLKDEMGKPFSGRLLIALDRLYGTGKFTVFLPYFERKNGKIILSLYVKEKPRALLSISGHYRSFDGFSFLNRISYENFLNSNANIQINLFLSKDRTIWGGFLLPVAETFEFFLFDKFKENSNFPDALYTEKMYEISAGIKFYAYISNLSAGLSYREYNGYDGRYRKYFLAKGNFILDKLNDKNVPIKGGYLFVNGEKTLKNGDYTKITFEFDKYFAVFDSISLYWNLFYGNIDGTDYSFNDKISYLRYDQLKFFNQMFDLKTGIKFFSFEKFVTPYLFIGYFSSGRKFSENECYSGIGFEKKLILLKYFKWEYYFSGQKNKITFFLGAKF